MKIEIEVTFQVGTSLKSLIDGAVQRLETTIMTTAADIKVKLDALAAETAKNSDLDASILAALNGRDQLVADLKKQIDDLKAQGGASQQELDDLAASADATLTALKDNNTKIADAITAGTDAAPTA